MFAVIDTGVAKLTCCQPEAVSPVNVAVASCVPVADQRFPMCVPVLARPCRTGCPDLPVESAVNFTPSSVDDGSPSSTLEGVVDDAQIEHAAQLMAAGVTGFDGGGGGSGAARVGRRHREGVGGAVGQAA